MAMGNGGENNPVVLAIHELQADLGTRIDGLGTGIEGLGTRIDGLGTRIDGLGVRLDRLEKVMLETRQELRQTNSRLEGIHSLAGEHYRALEARVAKLEQRLG